MKNINQALKDLKWSLENKWSDKVSKRDIETFNSILSYVDMQNSIKMNKNESLAKLWIHQIMLLNNTMSYSAERSIQVIDEILDKSVYEWCLKMHSQANIMAFNSVLGKDNTNTLEYILKPLDMRKIDSNKLSKKEKECWEALTKEIKEENIIKFVEKEINRIIDKYER